VKACETNRCSFTHCRYSWRQCPPDPSILAGLVKDDAVRLEALVTKARALKLDADSL
jgi:hypothetical protein